MLGLKEDLIDTAQDQHTDVAKEQIANICSRLSLHSYIHIFIYFYLSHSPLLVFFLYPASWYEGEIDVDELKKHPLIVLIAFRGINVRVNFIFLHILFPCIFIIYT